MKIKNLKHIFVLLLFTLFFCSITFGACNTNRPTTCSDGSSFDNNRIVNLDGSSLVYLKMFGIDVLGCTSGTVSEVADIVHTIQHSLNENCGANLCEDWRYGSSTMEALGSCAADYCRGKGQVAPNLSGNDLACDNLYILDESTHCCKSNACELLYGAENVQLLNEDGTCPTPGFAKDTLYSCCIKYEGFCDSETGYINLRSVTPNNTGLKCEECGYGKKPNEDHTKCVCNSEETCCGVELYLGIPFIGDCIEMNSDSSRPNTTTVSNVSAFPVLMQGLMKILMSVILVVSFMLVIISGLMMTAGAFKSTNFDKGKTMIKNVIISLILLGLSGLILKLINPSFFGG